MKRIPFPMRAALLLMPLALVARAEKGRGWCAAACCPCMSTTATPTRPPHCSRWGAVTAQNKVFPEVDFSYFFTPSIAAELILTYPQAHTVSLAGTPIGSLKHLPPTLTVQYHFQPGQDWQPYLGAGINYTRFMQVDLLGGAVTTDRDSVGLAAQAGVDYRLAPSWFLNADAKYVQIDTHVKLAASNTTFTTLKIDPWLLSLGFGYRF